MRKENSYVYNTNNIFLNDVVACRSDPNSQLKNIVQVTSQVKVGLYMSASD